MRQIVDDVKTDSSRKYLTIDAELLEVLKLWKQTTQFSATGDWVFASPSKLGRLPYSYTGFWRELERAAKVAGIGHLGTHAFRLLDTEQWNSDERDVLRENTAQAIHEQLETQDNLKPKYERRWIWELFQNALDATESGSEVKVRLTFGDSFVFAHNGAPFARKEICALSSMVLRKGSRAKQLDDTLNPARSGRSAIGPPAK